MAHEHDPVVIYAEISTAICELKARGLQLAVKWAAEQLVGLPEHAYEQGAKQAAEFRAQRTQPEHPRLIQGRAYFELKEYQRTAHVLHGLNTPVAIFLRCYALYLAGEKRKEEERIEASGPLGSAVTVNPYLDQVQAELSAAGTAGVMKGDAFGLYLTALTEIDRDHRDWARALLVQSLKAFPCNWGAWQALVGLCDDLEVVSTLDLPAHWSRNYFLAALCLELQHNAEALSRLQVINQLFPGSDWVASSAALAHYNMRNFDEAQALYEDLLARDQARLTGMDTYSNILFVKEAFAPLSHLAHRLAASDKYTPETCCVIGNYYSLKGQHERAVEYFRRALRLSRNYLSAWTLMGHEYVEMKNAPAAIDAYRAAVALNPRDYRAWYGLGQTYELLSMPYYALHYYRRAAMLRPSDPRMWCALGQCYESEGLRMPALAVRCYRRAVAHGDREGIGLPKLAKLHEAQGDRAAAAHYYSLNLARLDAEGAQGNDVTEALLYLAEYAKDCSRLVEAEQYCQRLLDVGGPANMRAKAILRDMRSSTNSAAAAAAARSGDAAAGPPAAAAGARQALGARRILGDAGGAAAAGGGGSSWLAQQQQQQQQQQYGYASPMGGNTPGAFSVVMDDSDEETPQQQQQRQQQQWQQHQDGYSSDDDMQLLAATGATPMPPTVAVPSAAAAANGMSTMLLPTFDAAGAAAAAAAAAPLDMDMSTPAPFSFITPTGPPAVALRPAAAAAVGTPMTAGAMSTGGMSISDTPAAAAAGLGAAAAERRANANAFPGFGITPGFTPPAAAAAAANRRRSSSPSGAAAARRTNLMHLLAPGLERPTGGLPQSSGPQQGLEEQQDLQGFTFGNAGSFLVPGVGVFTPGSGSDVFTPTPVAAAAAAPAAAAAGGGGLFASPPGGFSYDSPPSAGTMTPIAEPPALPTIRGTQAGRAAAAAAGRGSNGDSSALSPRAAAAAAELAASLNPRRGGSGGSRGRGSGRGSSSSSTPTAAATAVQVDPQMVQQVMDVTGARREIVEEALRDAGGDMMHAIIAVEQRRGT